MRNNKTNISSSNTIYALIAILLILVFNSNSKAQGAWSEKPKNLKVLPANISGDELRSTMQSFNTALGVHCNFCHDDSKGSDFRDIDFASDAKPTKKAAQVMLQMVASINGKSIKDAQAFKSDIGNVSCITCHRSSATIDMLEDILYGTYVKGGYDATLNKYQDLRQKYYGGFTYDFRDHTLLSLASKISDSGNFDDAVKIVNKDIELFPESSTPLVFMGNLYMKKGSNAEASKYLERALAIDPNNRFVGDMLKRLKNPEKK